MNDEYLSIASIAGTNTNGRNFERLCQLLRKFFIYTFDDDTKSSRRSDGLSIDQNLLLIGRI